MQTIFQKMSNFAVLTECTKSVQKMKNTCSTETSMLITRDATYLTENNKLKSVSFQITLNVMSANFLL